MWQAWANGILGLWIALSPFITMDHPSVRLNNITVGLITAVVGWYLPRENPFTRWFGVLLGVWVFVTGLVPGLSQGDFYLWTNLISGILIANTAYAPFLWNSRKNEC